MYRAMSGLAYRRQGNGATVVLLHGIPGQGRAWLSVEAELDGFDIVTVDLRGFGGSDGPLRPTLDEVGPGAQAAAVAALLDELGVRAATVVGHDFGAPVGALLAAARPDVVAAISLLSGNVFPDTPIPFPLSAVTVPVVGTLFAAALFSGPSLGLMLRRGTGADSPPPDPAVYLGDTRQRATIATIFRGALTQLETVYAPVADAVSAIDVPVVVGWGDHDPFFPLEQGQRTADAAGGRLHIFRGAGHFLPHERPREVASQIASLATAVNR